MRPRLPLCLLPFVGVLAFASAFTSSNAANIIIQNGYEKGTLDNSSYFAFDFNGLSEGNRTDYGIGTNNTLMNRENTFTFRVNYFGTAGADGIQHYHPGSGTDLIFDNAIVLYGTSEYGSKLNNTITLNNSNLTFNSAWGSPVPICKLTGLFDGQDLFMQNQWTYLSKMGIQTADKIGQKGSGDVTFNFTQNFTEFFVFRGEGSQSNEGLFCDAIVLVNNNTGNERPAQVLKENVGVHKPKSDLVQGNTNIANFQVTGNVNTLGGIIIYADQNGTFETGRSGATGNNQSNFLVSGGKSVFSLQEANSVDIFSNVVVTDHALFYIGVTKGKANEKVNIAGNVTVSEFGTFWVKSSGVHFDGQVNIINGGNFEIEGKNFQFNGDILISGVGTGSAPDSLKKSVFTVKKGATGDFLGKVRVEDKASLELYGESVIFKNELYIGNNGGLILGGVGVNTVEAHGGLVLANNARVEANTRGTANILDANKQNVGIRFQENGFFGIFQTPATDVNGVVTYDQPVYDGGFSVTKNKTITIQTAVSVSSTIANRGDYVLGKYGTDNIISGEGNINLFMYQNRQCMVLGSKNDFTGSTTITRGVLVLGNQTLGSNGEIISSSAGKGSSPIVFSNDPNYTNIASSPILALTSDFRNDGVNNAIKTLSKNLQIGTTWGTGYATFVTGSFSVINAAGDGYEDKAFADNVILTGQITSYNDTNSRYHFIKDGSGMLTLAGNGAGKEEQVIHNGYTVVRSGNLVLGNEGGTASLKNRAENAIMFDGTGATATLTINPMYTPNDSGTIANTTSFKNDIIVLSKGIIDLKGWANSEQWGTSPTQNIVMSGNIYDDGSPYSQGRVLEIYTTNDASKIANGLVLEGTISLTDGELKFFGNNLTLKGAVNSTTTLNLKGGGAENYASSNLIFDPSVDNTLFDATLVGANNLIKEGTNTLWLGSDLSSSTAYSGNTEINNGTLMMTGEGKLSETGNLILNVSQDQNNNVSKTGTLNLNNTHQTVGKLTGGGILDTHVGILSVTKGHLSTESFGGNVKGQGILSFEKKGTDAGTFNIGNSAAATPATGIDFSGMYAILNGATLNANQVGILADKAAIGIGDGSTLRLTKTYDTETVNALYSIDSDYKVAPLGTGTISLADSSALSVNMGYYAGNITQDTGTSPSEYALYKAQTTEVDADGELLGLYDAKGNLEQKNTLYLIGNGTTNQFKYNGKTQVDGGTLYLGVADGIEDEDQRKLDLSKTGEMIVDGHADAKNFTLDSKIDTQLIVDLANGSVIIKDITLTGCTALTVMNGSSNEFKVEGSMTLSGAKLNIQASLDANNRPLLQGIRIGGEVTVTITDKNYIDLQLKAGNWSYNADTDSAAGNTMEVFTADSGRTENINVVADRYVFLNQEKIFTPISSHDAQGNPTEGGKIDIKVTRNDVQFSDFITSSIGAALDHADAEYTTTNKLKGQAASTLGLVLDQMYVMMSQAEVKQAVQSLSGSSNYVVPTSQLIDLRQHVDAVRDRISRIGVQPGTNMTEETYNGWAMGQTSAVDLKGDGQVPGFKKDTWGGMVGFDTDVSNQLSWGMALGYTSTDMDIDGGDSATSDAYYLDGFARFQQDKWSFLGVATVGTATSDMKRRITVGEVNGIAKGSPDSAFFNVLAEAGYDIELPNEWLIQPLANINLGYLNVGSYTETGMGNAGLNVDATGQFIARLGAGVRSVYSFYEDAWSQKANLQLRAMVLQDLTDVSPAVTQSLIGSVGSFDADGNGMGKTAFQIGAGVTVPVAYNLSVFANVDAEFRSDANTIGGNIGVRYTF